MIVQAKLGKLKSLDLYGCPVTNQPGYRDQLFGLLPNLHLLDGLDKEGKEGQESSDDEEEDDYEGKEDGATESILLPCPCRIIKS